jgi:hypothetical protein
MAIRLQPNTFITLNNSNFGQTPARNASTPGTDNPGKVEECICLSVGAGWHLRGFQEFLLKYVKFHLFFVEHGALM